MLLQMKNFDWLYFKATPGPHFLNHTILATRLRSLLRWDVPNFKYEYTDYDHHAKEPINTETSIFTTKCELLYKDKVYTKITLMCIEDYKKVRIEFDTDDNTILDPPFISYDFDFIHNSFESNKKVIL